MDLASTIRDIPDFPKPGIVFKDITTLLADPAAYRASIDQMLAPFRDQKIDKIACIESRGFLFAGPMSIELGAGMVPLRKPGKLPAETVSAEYTLEYGTDKLEMHTDAVQNGDRVLLVDDLLATGGTAEAAGRLIESQGGEVVSYVFLIELAFLAGREKLGGRPVHVLVEYGEE